MRAQFTQFNVMLAVNGSEPLGLSIRTIHTTHGTFHEVARVVNGGQAELQDVRLGDIVVGINHNPIAPCLSHSQVVQRIVGASKRWSHMKLNMVRNHNCSDEDKKQLRKEENGAIVQLPSAEDSTCAVDFAGSQFLFRGCGPGPLNPRFVSTWKQVVTVQAMQPVHIWYAELCKRAGVEGSVSHAALRLQRKLSGRTIRRMLSPLLLPKHLVEHAHLLLCLRIMAKFIEDEADAEDICACSLIEQLIDITDDEWANMEFKLCNGIDWKLRELTEMQSLEMQKQGTQLKSCTYWCARQGGGDNICSCGYHQHQHQRESLFEDGFAPNKESGTHIACEPSTADDADKPRRLSDAEDRIALLLALDESENLANAGQMDDGECDITDSVPSSCMPSPHVSLPSSPSGTNEDVAFYSSPPPTDHTHDDHERLIKQSPSGSFRQRKEVHDAAAQRRGKYKDENRRIKSLGTNRVLDFVREKWQQVAGTPIETSPSTPLSPLW